MIGVRVRVEVSIEVRFKSRVKLGLWYGRVDISWGYG